MNYIEILKAAHCSYLVLACSLDILSSKRLIVTFLVADAIFEAGSGDSNIFLNFYYKYCLFYSSTPSSSSMLSKY